MTDTTWRDVLLVVPGRLAGVRVRPFCAWHGHAMMMLGIDLLPRQDGDTWAPPDPSTLAQAIAILRCRFAMSRPGVPVVSRWLAAWLRLRWRFVDYREDALAILRWIRRYDAQPDISAKSTGGTSAGGGCGSPPYMLVAVAMCERFRIGIEEALNMPINWCHVVTATMLDLQGVVTCSWKDTDGPQGQAILKAFATAQEAIAKAGRAANG